MIKPILMTAGILVSGMAFAAENYVMDPQLTEYRASQGKNGAWISHEDSDGGLGDVGSSGDTAFGEQGSARFRFRQNVAEHDFTATPGLTQVVTGLPKNTAMIYSLYYCDKKGEASPSTLYYGVREVIEGKPLTGKVIAEKRAHTKDLGDMPKGDVKDCFRQVSVDFNSGTSGNVEIFSMMEVKGSNPSMAKDIEVRVDEFSVTAK